MSFTPPYPKPLKTKASAAMRFVTNTKSWIHGLFEKSYTMQMGEVTLPRLKIYMPNELSLVDEILEDRRRVFPKHHNFQQMLDPLIGNSIFTANGPDWEAQRAMVKPAYAQTGLKRAFPVMRDAIDEMVAQIRALDLTRPVGVEPLMTHVAADIIFRTIFSRQVSADDSERIYRFFNKFQRAIQTISILKTYGMPVGPLVTRARRFTRHIHATFLPIVEARLDTYRTTGDAGPDDILRSMLEARHPETAESFTLEQLINQVSTVFLAGHETAASAMSWGLYLLAECPHVQDALLAEIGPEPLTFERMRSMEKLRQFFQETLRLYPPVSFFIREVTEPTTMRAKEMAPGSMIIISPWLIQRNEANFPCPHVFDPDRFSDPEQAEACRRAYMPFGRGTRICIGAGFAHQEAMLTFGAIIQAFRLSYPHGAAKPEPVSRVTLRSDKGIFLQFTQRA
jgi:cytochrome P450